MRTFNVKVNGKVYNVEVEETAGSPAASPAPAPAAVFAPVQVQTPAPQKVVSAVPSGGTPVKCPMPGLVLNLLVPNGAQVKKNQKVLVLEAMKMENDILASADGVISFTVKKGDSADTGTILAIIK